ncbi:MAG: hypothetical protein AB1634_05890, partial [Thermodesulfobacteriota bacterium]
MRWPMLLSGWGVVLLLASQVQAQVTGVCSNCHTMHNSQNGAGLASAGTGARWDGGAVQGGVSAAAQASLLVTDCVGCHSSNGSASTITLGDSVIPIVYNAVAPTSPLAGGNFYWVAAGGDAYGHNVRGISDQDASLPAAPGAVGCLNSCHTALTLSD